MACWSPSGLAAAPSGEMLGTLRAPATNERVFSDGMTRWGLARSTRL